MMRAKENKFVLRFDEIKADDVALVGGEKCFTW